LAGRVVTITTTVQAADYTSTIFYASIDPSRTGGIDADLSSYDTGGAFFLCDVIGRDCGGAGVGSAAISTRRNCAAGFTGATGCGGGNCLGHLRADNADPDGQGLPGISAGRGHERPRPEEKPVQGAISLTEGCPTDGCPTHDCPTDDCPTDRCRTDVCPTDGCPTDGCPTVGCPTDGCPTDGCPTDGCPCICAQAAVPVGLHVILPDGCRRTTFTDGHATATQPHRGT